MNAADRERIVARFARRVNKIPGGCWLWIGCATDRGYCQTSIGGRLLLVHRLSYELHVGPIPDGLTIDHVKARGCTSRRCVNPAHLEAVTRGENVLRGDTITARNVRKTHCPRGHEYTAENTYTCKRGMRQCKACHTLRNREKAARRRSGRVIVAHTVEDVLAQAGASNNTTEPGGIPAGGSDAE